MKTESATVTHLRNFFNCVRTRETPIEDIEVDHYTAAVAYMANISNEKKEIVTWDKKKKIVND